MSKNSKNIDEYFNNIIDSIEGSIYWKDKNGVYLGCNRYAARMVGASSPEELIGKTDYDLFSKQEADVFRYHDLEVMQSNSPRTVEEKGISPAGEEIVQLSVKRPLYNNKGELIGIIGNTINITELKAANDRANKEHAKAEAEEMLRNVITTYAGAIAHNQRSTLFSIQTIADYIGEIYPKLLAIYEEAKQVKLPSAKLISKQDLSFLKDSPINDLKECVSQMRNIISNNLESLKQAIRIHLEQGCPADLIECDIKENLMLVASNHVLKPEEKQLIHIDWSNCFNYMGNSIAMDQVISNLLHNAIYQIRKNQRGEVYITMEVTDKANILRFKDTAGGASSEVVAKMFESNFTTKPDGNGIGLDFCKKTLKLFGGDITALSLEGEYMEFTLTFPKI